jgi:hypothetical protein
VRDTQDRWRVDDGWWQRDVWGEISRMYYAVELEGGQLLTVFQDLLDGRWYEQTAAVPVQHPTSLDLLQSKALEHPTQHGLPSSASGAEGVNAS